MLQTRVMPCLLLKRGALVKTVKFNKFSYIGDAINTIRIFNQMEVDELILLDIDATVSNAEPSFNLIEDIASECFMPFAYGGGIRNIDHVKQLFKIGIEKVILNSYAFENPDFVKEVASVFGSQSVIVSIDVKKKLLGNYEVYIRSGTLRTGTNPVAYAKLMEKMGAGELFLNSIDRDGTWAGYDVELIKSVTSQVSVPVICCGGAGKIDHFTEAVVEGGTSAVAAGSMFVYQKKDLGVLINFPSRESLEKALN